MIHLPSCASDLRRRPILRDEARCLHTAAAIRDQAIHSVVYEKLIANLRWRGEEGATVLPQPWGNLGLCLMMQLQFDAAEAALQRALEIHPSYTIARQNPARLPKIGETELLPVMQISSPFEGRNVKRSLSFLAKDEKR